MNSTSLFKAEWMWPTITPEYATFHSLPVLSLEDACFWFWRVRSWECTLALAGEVEVNPFTYSGTVSMSAWSFSNLVLTLQFGHQTSSYSSQIEPDPSAVYLNITLDMMGNGASHVSGYDATGGWVPEIAVNVGVSEIAAVNDVEVGIGADPGKAQTGSVTFAGYDADRDQITGINVPVRYPVKTVDNPIGFSAFSCAFNAVRYWSHNSKYDEFTGALL